MGIAYDAGMAAAKKPRTGQIGYFVMLETLPAKITLRGVVFADSERRFLSGRESLDRFASRRQGTAACRQQPVPPPNEISPAKR